MDWKNKNVGYLSRKGGKERKPVTDERDGTVGGYHIEHWDDHQDAIVMPKTVDISLKVNK